MTELLKDVFHVEYSITDVGEKSKVVKIAATLTTQKGLDDLVEQLGILRGHLPARKGND